MFKKNVTIAGFKQSGTIEAYGHTIHVGSKIEMGGTLDLTLRSKKD